jgi:hypothetical protein
MWSNHCECPRTPLSRNILKAGFPLSVYDRLFGMREALRRGVRRCQAIGRKMVFW